MAAKKKRTHIPIAREIMQKRVHTVSESEEIGAAVRALLKKGHSGAPVLDRQDVVVGVLSEHDCVEALAQAAADGWPSGVVADHMTKDVEAVPPTEDLFALSTRFTQGRHRRLLVVENAKLIGLITRRDLLRALEAFEAALGRERRATTYESIAKRRHELD